MSTQTQTETIVLQPRNANTQLQEPESSVSQESEPNQQPQTKWLYPKIFSAGVSFFVAGVNDGSLGSLIPYIIRSYDIGTNMVAVLYGVTFFGWFFAALSNSFIVRYLDLGALLSLGAALQILAHVLRTWLPPFPLYAVTFLLASLGQALNDTHANTFVSSQHGAHRWLGFIHAMYMAGCLVGPFVATAVASANTDSKWNLFYVFPLGLGVINLTFVALSFHDRMTFLQKKGREGERSAQSQSALAGKNALQEIKTTLSTPGVWLLSLFFFFFLGASITAGGWMVEYLVKVRHGDVKNMGYVPAGFYGGGFLGRLFLAEPTHRLGERRMIFIYAVLCVALQLVFWLVPNIITEAVAVSLLGLFSGPFFPTGISVGSKIFDPEIVSSGIAFVFVLGQIGGSIFPAITGVIAAQVGVKVLQPMLVGLLCAAGVSWLFLPKDAALHRD
ncbi:Major facilitator superfamily domain general substrate transporter [Penicillium verhagenii]|uniref:Major facilitator superfamily domain general substrate transporter n=1 Tax=Penicillium verhagenii TaxID=1562060 RepID=UPI002544E4BB|nr:Major facilitator superfamily domain general substrate transporter [Penicillium verhagenii]KAJ5924216.1 Major facilitator superfamily domain general substrate transporter [Penicillium verhagenii]